MITDLKLRNHLKGKYLISFDLKCPHCGHKSTLCYNEDVMSLYELLCPYCLESIPCNLIFQPIKNGTVTYT